MRALSAVFVMAVGVAVAGCGGSSSGPAATAPSTSASTSSPSPTATPVALAGKQPVDISWGVGADPGVACPKGLHGYCSHVTGSGSSDELGVLSVDEFLSTPKDGSCSTGKVEGTIAMTDAASSAMPYTGVGHFCWKSLTGVFHLTLGKGTGQFKGARGTLVARITNTDAFHDEWKGAITFRS